MYCTHTVEPSDLSIICNLLQSHLRLNLLLLDLFFPSNSPRRSGHFWMCVNCEVLSTGVFSLPQGKRLPPCTYLLTQTKGTFHLSTCFILQALRGYYFKCCWRRLWSQKKQRAFVVFRKTTFHRLYCGGCCDALVTEEKHSKKCELLQCFLAGFKNNLKLHSTDEAHGMRFALWTVFKNKFRCLSF